MRRPSAARSSATRPASRHLALRRARLVRAACAWLCLAVAPAAGADPLAEAIDAELGALLNPGTTGIQGAGIAFGERLHEFYSRRGFRAAWTSAEPRQQLLTLVADSYADGLDPADYLQPQLETLAGQLAGPGATEVLKARYDILMTEALLRLSYHLSFGKVDAETFDAQWNYGRVLPRTDVARAIEDAIASDSVRQRVEALKPDHRLYTALRQELARHRAIAKDGGWNDIPAGPPLRPGDSDARIPALRTRLIRSGDHPDAAVADSPVYDETLAAAVRRFQRRHGLDPDAVVGAGTVTELNVPVASRIEQLRINLDRGRVLLHDLPARFVVVNIAGYDAYLVDGGEVAWSTRVQVGKPYRRTPLFRSEITYLVFNPTWTVPPGIIKADILPAARQDPRSITRKGLKVLDAEGRERDPETIDWTRFKSGHIPYTLRQEPGPANALGRVKFMFPNAYQVYLHDTPSQAFFERADRAFSSGCVRVERALELAERVLDDPERWNRDAIARVVAAGQLQNVRLKTPLPVLLVYWTAWVDADGITNFRRDPYGQDARWAEGLNAPFAVRALPLFSAAKVHLVQLTELGPA